MHALRPLAIALLVACGSGGDTDQVPTTNPNPGTPGGTPGGTPTGTTPSDSGLTTGTPTGTTSTQVFDCDNYPAGPWPFAQVPNARGYHGLAIDEFGQIIGANAWGGADLVAVDSTGVGGIYSPNIGDTQQLAWAPSGDLAVATGTGIKYVTPNGAQSTLNNNISAYGLKLGPDNMWYAADQNQIWRVDPVSGAAEVILASGALPQGSPRVINFSLDYTKLFIGTLSGSNGRIYELPLDATYTPTGPPVEFTSGIGSGSYHDTLGVDICGFLYVADYSYSTLYRIHPVSGNFEEIYTNQTQYGHGMTWGNNTAGFPDTAIYLSQPYNNEQVIEIQIGVPERGNPNWTAINIPQ